jgi:hypothetical protein
LQHGPSGGQNRKSETLDTLLDSVEDELGFTNPSFREFAPSKIPVRRKPPTPTKAPRAAKERAVASSPTSPTSDGCRMVEVKELEIVRGVAAGPVVRVQSVALSPQSVEVVKIPADGDAMECSSVTVTITDTKKSLEKATITTLSSKELVVKRHVEVTKTFNIVGSVVATEDAEDDSFYGSDKETDDVPVFSESECALNTGSSSDISSAESVQEVFVTVQTKSPPVDVFLGNCFFYCYLPTLGFSPIVCYLFWCFRACVVLN